MPDRSPAQEASAAIDIRLASGVPEDQRPAPEEFIRITGILRRKLDVPDTGQHPPREILSVNSASLEPAAEANDFLRSAGEFIRDTETIEEADPLRSFAGWEPRDRASESASPSESPDNAYLQRRADISSRLIEAEQLLQALERQPREGRAGAAVHAAAPVHDAHSEVITAPVLPAAPVPAPAPAARPRGRLRLAANALRLALVAGTFAGVFLYSLTALHGLRQIPLIPQSPAEVPQFSLDSPAPTPEMLLQQFPVVQQPREIQELQPPFMTPSRLEQTAPPSGVAPAEAGTGEVTSQETDNRAVLPQVDMLPSVPLPDTAPAGTPALPTQ